MGRNAYCKLLRRSVIDWDRKVLSLFYKLPSCPWCCAQYFKSLMFGWPWTIVSDELYKMIWIYEAVFYMTSRRPYWFPRQWNGGHVGVPNQSCWSRISSYVNASFCCNNAYAYIDAGHVSENALLRHGSAEELWRHQSGRHLRHHNVNRQIKSNDFLNP